MAPALPSQPSCSLPVPLCTGGLCAAGRGSEHRVARQDPTLTLSEKTFPALSSQETRESESWQWAWAVDSCGPAGMSHGTLGSV